MSAVYTCTMNLAIDLFIETEHLYESTVNRTLSDDIQANGKGVNVSLILQRLGIANTALGFSGGFTGRYIADVLSSEGVKPDFVQVEGMTRINVMTRVNATGQEFKLINRGPEVGLEAQESLLAQIAGLKKGDCLVLSGSLPRGVEPSILKRIAALSQEKQFSLVLDISHKVLLDCLPYQPFLLKPNEEELASWFGQEHLDDADIIRCARELQSRGAQHILVSLGAKGALYLDPQGQSYRCTAPTGKVVNTACAGDAMLGTFLAGLLKGEELSKILPKSVAAGSSTAFRSGLTDFEDVPILEKQIIFTKMEE